MRLYDQVFLTGCDRNSEWMIPWFIKNYKKHNKTPLVFANFGLSETGLNHISSFAHETIDLTKTKEKGWFKKPQAILETTKIAKKVCWLDTDCEVLADLSDVFTLTESGKIGMVEDKPWTKRRGETWHNTGVVVVEGNPVILQEWIRLVKINPQIGDQEVLHTFLRQDMRRHLYVTDLPEEYNWVRLNLVDGRDSKRKKVMHWTGQKGKMHIYEETRYG